MNFLDYYFKENTFYIPIDFDLCSFNEEGELEIGIPLKYLSQLIENDVIRLSRDGKTFKSLKEAYDYFDSLSEAKKDWKKNKFRTKVQDPETGIERDFEVAAGNAKIGGDTVIINMSTVGNCMSAIIGTCKLGADGRCYALRFEKEWKNSRAKNIRHEAQWACLTARGIAQGLYKISQAMPSIKYVRINEAGEIRNLPSDPELLAKVSDEKKAQLAGVDDVAKLQQVGEELKKLGSPLILYTYTHRSDLKIGDLGENICVNGSGFMLDNSFVPLELYEFNKVMDMIESKTLKEFNGVPVTRGVRCIGDCRKCSYCKKKEKKHIFLPIHGSGTQFELELEKILTSVIKNPEFDKIYNSPGNPREKGEQSLALIPDNMKKMFQRLVPIRQDRVGLLADIIKSRGDQDKLIQAIEAFVAKPRDGNLNVHISNEDSTEGLAKSVDALTGKFETEMQKAIAQGQVKAQKKWGSLIKTLQKAIEQAKTGKKPKVTATLAQQHAGVWQRLKRQMKQ